MAATLLRARSLKGALASHSSREIWGFGGNVGVGGAAGRRCALDRTADIVPQWYESSDLMEPAAKHATAAIQYKYIDVPSVLHYKYVLIVRPRVHGGVYQFKDNWHSQ